MNRPQFACQGPRWNQSRGRQSGNGRTFRGENAEDVRHFARCLQRYWRLRFGVDGLGMLNGNSAESDASAQDQPSAPTSLTPLILFAASPGTITAVITLAVAHWRTDLPVTALVAIAVTIVVTFCVMLLIAFLGGQQQGGFFRETVTRFMGLIVVAMGVQFALTGFKSFMS